MMISNPTLLIVDDESSIRTTLFHVFTELDYSVHSASDGFSGLALIQVLGPEILLSDLNMPGMSGFELLSVVRRVHPAIHVIATSGSFPGKSVPPGIAADAFYEKATGLSFLFEDIKQPAQSDWALRRSSNGPTAIWRSPTGRFPSEEVFVLMSCPRCLRAFPKVLVERTQLIHETGCFYCGATIPHAIVPPNDSATGVSFAPSYLHGTIDIYGLSMKSDVLSTDHHDSKLGNSF